MIPKVIGYALVTLWAILAWLWQIPAMIGGSLAVFEACQELAAWIDEKHMLPPWMQQ